METGAAGGVTLYFEAGEREAADLFADACTQSASVISNSWGLEPPRACRVYVMTSWMRFYFHSAPWPQRILYGLTLPLWYGRMKRLWPFIGGWTQLYRARPAVGVKPPRLIDISDRSIGERIYIKEDNLIRKVQCAICHELAHAFSAHLKLPLWLNEGVAMVTVDRFIGRQTVKPETIGTLRSYPRKAKPAKPRELFKMDHDTLAYQYIRAYWMVRYLEEERPGLVRSLLSRRQRAPVHERRVAQELGIEPRLLWREIDEVVGAHFAEPGGEP
jgi:hypothetical protein